MKLGLMQPYFLPYIGYWQLINMVDKYVIYDDVQFIKGGWINRNSILVNGEKQLFNLILKGASPNKLISEVLVNPNQGKLLRTFENVYARAPYYDLVFPLIQKIVGHNDLRLSGFIGNSIIEICNYLKINTQILYSSELKKDNSLKGLDKVIHICKLLNADIYVNAIGGMNLYDKNDFSKENIELLFLKPELAVYPQFKNEFVPWLSIMDILMFNSQEDCLLLLNKYSLE